MPTEINILPTQLSVGKTQHPMIQGDAMAIIFVDQSTNLVYTVTFPKDGADELVRQLQETLSGVSLPPKPQIIRAN